ncbi:pyrroloquinoline quinone biosynthesis protein PqqE, partial [Mesorhizobium sp. M7A.F.Ca.CA.002.03.2.1]
QAMAIAGDAAATDPACAKSPIHARMAMLIDEAKRIATVPSREEAFVYRRIGAVTESA